MKLVASDLEQVLANLGMRLGKSGETEVWALCPGHDDHNPTSFSVNRESGASFCFACGYRRSDLVALVVDVKGIDAWSAAGWLREHGASLTARIERVRDRVPTKRAARTLTASGYSIEGEFSIFKDVPDKALEERLLRRESADFYEVRWHDGDFIIPVKDTKGKLQGWQQRRKPRPKNYPKNIRKSDFVFGAYEFSGKRAIIVESPLDVVRLHSEGYDGAVATMGSWVSPAQLRVIEQLARSVLIAMDDPEYDEAGEVSTIKLLDYFAPKVPTWVFSYDHIDSRLRGEGVKDVGDMESDEIHQGVREAVFAAQAPRKLVRVARR